MNNYSCWQKKKFFVQTLVLPLFRHQEYKVPDKVAHRNF